ncbi:hypothetical protein DFQ14_10167 [Halopolyspora algeriensis]|uniref:Uncharacterized protein n=1 Tax=Halopolyspora algeriensis TaxID=1500506 RepID=A0A368VXP7_9ACTN|nr:hypothetical protein [Halopolyspora algeriensis]RCW46731.1 hypothetical protein DFQ14_10167 [Halopolyspora algeriensis]TQM46756.1 hypothetical protein FHU43_3877 [Halopolyspora algeriensis]
MGAIVVAIMVGLFAVGLVAALAVMSAFVVVGLKAINVVHDGSNWLIDHWHRRPTH